jgi:hypothetical protein
MARKVMGPTGSRRRRWLFLCTSAAAIAAAVLIIPSAFAVLGSASFDTSNGNLTPSATNLHDWNPAGLPDSTNPLGPIQPIICGPGTTPPTTGTYPGTPGSYTNCGVDWLNSSSDNSFTQGTKEDTTGVVVSTGSIPPNKDDLTRFYINTEKLSPTTTCPGPDGQSNSATGCTYLDMAWERSNLIGSAHMDFEFNQHPQPALTCASGSCPFTLNRTAGDILIDFDFGGSGPVTLTLHRWLVGDNNPSADCEAVSSGTNVSCWGKGVDITAVKAGEASVNTTAVTDYNAPPASGGTSLPGNISKQGTVSSTFGEAGVNLTELNIFPANQCFHLGDAWLKSRSSGSSFTSDMKDFIAPIPINISNCGTVIIHKQTDPRGKPKDFPFTTNIVDNPATPGADSGCAEQTSGTTSYTLNDNGNTTDNNGANTDNCPSVPASDYTVSEGTVPNGFTFEKLDCTTTDGATVNGVHTITGGTATSASIHVEPDSVTECTFTNQLNTAKLTTQVSDAGPVFPSTAVHDTATVMGTPSTAGTPGGTVTFFMCSYATGSTAVCDGTTGNVGTSIGTGGLTGSGNTASATSPDVNTSASPLTPGRYCFRAEWPGDNTYVGALKEFSGSTECFTVRTIPTTTTTTPSVGSGATTTFNSLVTDNAFVQATMAGDGTPTGTVTFFICDPTQTSGGACPALNGTQVGSPVTLAAVSGSSPPASSADSSTITANKTGTWCFRAVYTPGGANGSNYTGSSDASSGECFTVNDTTSGSSEQDWLPNDTAHVAAAHGAPLNGTLKAQLYTDDQCGANGGSAVSGQLYQKTLTNATSAADRTLTTGNTTYKVTSSTIVSWLVTFTSTDPNVSGSSHCEKTSLTITN